MSSLYYYSARAQDGTVVRGSVQARDRDAALSTLRARPFFLTSLDEAKTVKGALISASSRGTVTAGIMLGFYRAFATMTRAGVPVRRTLDVLAQQPGNDRLREALKAAAGDIDRGLLLSDAFARHPREFSSVDTTMIRAGERAGALDDVLDRLANSSSTGRHYASG